MHVLQSGHERMACLPADREVGAVACDGDLGGALRHGGEPTEIAGVRLWRKRVGRERARRQRSRSSAACGSPASCRSSSRACEAT